MLLITDKRMVTTRKVHVCFGCQEEIEKGKMQFAFVRKKMNNVSISIFMKSATG